MYTGNCFIGIVINGINLSRRESECIYYLMRGMTAKQIGMKLKLSYRTIEGYVVNIKDKLNCGSRFDIINKAWNNGFPFAKIAKFLTER